MNKTASFKSFGFKKRKDLFRIETSTQLTDCSEFIIFTTAFETPKKIKPDQDDEPSNEKLISRTSSVTLFKQPSRLLQLSIFGTSLRLEVSQKDDNSRFLENWLSSVKISRQKRAQIKLVIYEELFKRNIEFKELLESSLQQYADIKMEQIQEQEQNFHKEFK